jgi:hypothetical protein
VPATAEVAATASAVPAAPMLRKRGLRRKSERRGGYCSEKKPGPGRNTRG